MASQTAPQKSSVPLILLLLLLLGLGILLLPTINVRVNSGMQSASDGQCQSGGQGFDERQEAFILAQTAEQYRRTKPFGGNYGLSSYTICYKDGAQQRFQSNVFKGYDNLGDASNPQNYTHSEQVTYGWLQTELSRLPIDTSKVLGIYTIIFSQIPVCPPCRRDMVSWQQTLRRKARTNMLFLSIWDIPLGKGFDPKKYPAGNNTPVAMDDLRKVLINFVP